MRQENEELSFEQPRTPLDASDSAVGELCPFCRRRFETGDVLKLVRSGPADEIELALARLGLPYVEAPPLLEHYDCGDPAFRARGGAGSAVNAKGR